MSISFTLWVIWKKSPTSSESAWSWVNYIPASAAGGAGARCRNWGNWKGRSSVISLSFSIIEVSQPWQWWQQWRHCHCDWIQSRRYRILNLRSTFDLFHQHICPECGCTVTSEIIWDNGSEPLLQELLTLDSLPNSSSYSSSILTYDSAKVLRMNSATDTWFRWVTTTRLAYTFFRFIIAMNSACCWRNAALGAVNSSLLHFGVA